MSIDNNFPNLWQLLAGYFYDSSFEKLNDKEIIALFRSHFDDPRELDKRYSSVIQEIDQSILDIESHWQGISLDANRVFKNAEDAKAWLIQIQKWLVEFR